MINNKLLLETIYMQEDLNQLHEGFGDTVRTFIGDPNKMNTFISKVKNIKNGR